MSLEPKLVLNYPSTSAEAAVNSPAIGFFFSHINFNTYIRRTIIAI